jgi:hypothetical protein
MIERRSTLGRLDAAELANHLARELRNMERFLLVPTQSRIVVGPEQHDIVATVVGDNHRFALR